MDFKEMSPQECSRILSEKQDIDIVVETKITGINTQGDTDLSTPVEIPPSAQACTAEGLAHLTAYSPPGDEGRWNMFFVQVYSLGGKILFSQLSDSMMLASVKWAKKN